MLSLSKNQGGFTMIELMVGVGILLLLFATGAPSIATMMQNSQIRTASDAILNGLQLTRSEAVKRNTTVRFQLTDNLGNSCALVTNTSNWVISLNDPTGKCDQAPADPPASPAAPDPANPYIIQTRSGADGSRNAVVAAGQSAIIFNGLGRLPAGAATVNIAISNPTGGSCASAGGTMRCMNISITSGGQIRMCNPALPSTNAQGC